MKPDDRITKEFPVQVCVYLGSQNGFMTQHFLHGAKVRTSFNQMCGKRMPEGVGTNLFFYSAFFNQVA